MTALLDKGYGSLPTAPWITADTTSQLSTRSTIYTHHDKFFSILTSTPNLLYTPLRCSTLRPIPAALFLRCLHVISIPGQDAEVGSLYVYSPQFANSERFQIADYNFDSTLVNAPSGMIVNDDGDIVWVPTVDQMGEHTIQIDHHFLFIQTGEIETETETFVIYVVDENSLFGEETDTEILSTPDMSAFENTNYIYQIDAYDPGGTPTFELAQAPQGMTVDSNGLVSWNVPNFITAYFPVQIVVKFTNGETEEQEFILDVVTLENSLESSSMQTHMWEVYK